MKTRLLMLVTGGISAYRALDVLRELRRCGVTATTIMTTEATKFVTPTSVGVLSQEPVYLDEDQAASRYRILHIQLPRAVDAIVVCPATANFLAKAANGLADDLASAAVLASGRPVVFFPAMNPEMWNAESTRRNVARLRADGHIVIDPTKGVMASRGEEGVGRLPPVSDVVEHIYRRLLPSPLHGIKALVTSGPTWEAIDAVRGLSNRSSGKQGHAVALALCRAGADVTLVSGPVSLPTPLGAKLVAVCSAEEMHRAVMAELPGVAIAVCAAAVADWTVSTPAIGKLKKGSSTPVFELQPTQDILHHIGHHPERPRVVVGFAAETDHVPAYAMAKLRAKNADVIMANDVTDGRIFDSDFNEVTFVTAAAQEPWGRATKDDVAARLVEWIIGQMAMNREPAASPARSGRCNAEQPGSTNAIETL